MVSGLVLAGRKPPTRQYNKGTHGALVRNSSNRKAFYGRAVYAVTRERRHTLLKTVPGLLISGFFLWWTFRKFNFAELEQIRVTAPLWFLGVLAGTCASYWLRSFRWWRMMRSSGSRLRTCFRVFLTSLAANNILPLRIGDVMRMFTYAPDLHASPSVILSTLIIEKLLDVFTLVLFIVLTLHTGRGVSSRTAAGAWLLLGALTLVLLLIVLGAHVLEGPVRRLFSRLPARLAKLEHWLVLALEAVRQIGFGGMGILFLLSLSIWSSEGFFYLSAMKMVSLRSDWGAPWQTVAAANLSFLIPSSPGGIGTFELTFQRALAHHGVALSAAGLFGLLIHAWLFLTITGTGGAMFLVHRLRQARRRSLLDEIETLPAALP